MPSGRGMKCVGKPGIPGIAAINVELVVIEVATLLFSGAWLVCNDGPIKGDSDTETGARVGKTGMRPPGVN